MLVRGEPAWRQVQPRYRNRSWGWRSRDTHMHRRRQDQTRAHINRRSQFRSCLHRNNTVTDGRGASPRVINPLTRERPTPDWSQAIGNGEGSTSDGLADLEVWQVQTDFTLDVLLLANGCVVGEELVTTRSHKLWDPYLMLNNSTCALLPLPQELIIDVAQGSLTRPRTANYRPSQCHRRASVSRFIDHGPPTIRAKWHRANPLSYRSHQVQRP